MMSPDAAKLGYLNTRHFLWFRTLLFVLPRNMLILLLLRYQYGLCRALVSLCLRAKGLAFSLQILPMKKIITLLALCAALQSQAQYTELGVMGGASLYSGDLSPNDFGLYLDNLHPAFGVFVRRQLGPYLALRGGLSFAKVSGNDSVKGENAQGFNFRSNITEGALTAEFYPFHLGNLKRLDIAPYIFGGAAFFRFRPEALFDDSYIELQPLGTEGQGLPGYDAPYSLTQFSVPAGLGIRFTFQQQWSLGLEFGGRKLFTDYLDDVSNASVRYLDVLEGNGTIAAQLSNPSITKPEDGDVSYVRGGKPKDWYYIGGVTLSFRLGSANGYRGGSRGQIGCPGSRF